MFFYFLISCLLYYNQSMQSGTQYYKKNNPERHDQSVVDK
ncbi:hypothetical protein HMPREF2533_00224 [Bacteroides fragilis]|nr:hypothetical protein HMPREF2530_00224 [Bacteroides fragilis]KXU51051.1 hypothetical protein HMPREF2533_00224 [Bacteroides fragilis]